MQISALAQQTIYEYIVAGKVCLLQYVYEQFIMPLHFFLFEYHDLWLLR